MKVCTRKTIISALVLNYKRIREFIIEEYILGETPMTLGNFSKKPLIFEFEVDAVNKVFRRKLIVDF